MHLERRNSGKKHDPNQNVNHKSQDFQIELKINNKTDVILKYPGTIRNAIRLRATMKDGIPVGSDRFSNVTMNLDKADILLQRQGSDDYEHIIGYEGSGDEKTKIESKLWLGANFNTSIIPSNWNSRPFGSWTQTGTYPYAHSSPDKIYDDYFFSDFYTRIDKTDFKKLTDLPTNARYNDGKYKLKPTVTNVRDELFTIPAINFSLDNFKPYISFFNVKTNGSPIYQLNRTGSEGDEKTTDDGTVSNEAQKYALKIVEDGPNTLSIEITTSEPMQNLQFAHKKETQTAFSPPAPMIPNGSNKLKWSGNISTTFSQGDCFNVQFFGQDLSTNQILGIHKNTNKNKAGISVKIPTRKGNGPNDWNNKPTNSGMDQIDFCIEGCTKRLLSDNTGNRNSSDCESLSEVSSSINYISCKNAEITIEGTGFVPGNFTITWTDGSGNSLPQYQDDAQINVFNAGTYCYKIEAVDDCCEMEGCVDVIAEELLKQDFNLDIFKNTECNKETVMIWDSKSEYNYKWSNSSNQANVHTVTSPGEYSVTITNKISGCQQIETFEFLDHQFSLDGTVTQPSCNEAGMIDLSVIQNDGSLELRYLWSDGSREEDRYELAPGQYCVTVTNGDQSTQNNSLSCKQTKCFEIYTTPFYVNVLLNQTSCNGLPESLILKANMNNGQIGTFKYLWDNGTTTAENTVTQAGEYCYTVTDVNTGACVMGCYNVRSISLVKITTSTYPICTEFTGKINTIITNGSPPFTFKWSNGATTQNVVGLTSGTYTVTVSDDSNCTATAVSTIELMNLEANINFYEIPISCAQREIRFSNNFITTFPNANQHILPLTYKWSTGETGIAAIVTKSGEYCLTITTANNCTFSKCINVSLEPQISFNVTQNTNCPNPPGNGVINVNATGGTPPYQYSFNPGPQNTSNPSLTGLVPGSYNVVVSDVNGCKSSKYVQIEHSNGLNLTVETNDPCAGSNTGQVKIKLKWESFLMNLYQVDNNGNRVLYFSQYYFTDIIVVKDLPVGSYFVEVTDLNNCDYGYKTFEIKQSNKPSINSLDGAVQCVVLKDGQVIKKGTISISFKGGVSPFSYKWSSGQTTQNIQVESAGTYTVSITDRNGCYDSKSFNVSSTENNLIVTGGGIDNPNGCSSWIDNLNTGINIINGNPPYNIKIGGSGGIPLTELYKHEIMSNQNGVLLLPGFIKTPQFYYWNSFTSEIEVTDACGLKTYLNKAVVCEDFCDFNCVKISLEATGITGCAKVISSAAVGWVVGSKFEVKSTCNSNEIEVYNTVQNEYITINGGGTERFLNELFYDGWYHFRITNKTTGCVKNEWIKTKACKSFAKWFFNSGGSPSTGGSGPSSCESGDWQFKGNDAEKCEKVYYCEKNGSEKSEKVSLKKCSDMCWDKNNKKFFINYEICPLDNLCEHRKKISESTNQEHPLCPCNLKACPIFRPSFDPPTCADIVKCVVADSINDNYIMFWNDYDSLNQKVLKGYFFKDSAYPTDFGPFSKINTSLDIEQVKTDKDYNHYILGKNGNYYFEKRSIDNQFLWSVNLSNINVKGLSSNKSGDFDLTGFDMSNNNVLVNVKIDQNGNVLSQVPVTNISGFFDKTIQEDGIFYSLKKSSNEMYIISPNNLITKQIPSNIIIKDININGNNIIVAGEFNGQTTLAGKNINTNSYTNIIFLTYDKLGNLLKAKVALKPNNMSVDGFEMKDPSDITFYGKIETISYGPTTEENIIDSCTYIYLFSLEEDDCPSFTSTLTSHRTPCQLTWNDPPTGYTSELQWNENGIWIEVSSIGLVAPGYTSPFTVLKDGTYRLIHKKEGCPDVVSNSVSTTCYGICVCPAPVLSYDNQACHLTWSTVECPGYTARLQRQNANGWDDIALTAASPYTVTAAGIYRVLLTKPGCSQVLSNVVTTTACTPNTNPCTCTTASQLTLNTSACSLSWNTPSCSGYTSTLQRFVAGAWTTINSTNPYAIPANNNGQYRILTSKPGCGDLVSNVVTASCSCSSPASITVFNSTYGLGQNVNLQKSQTYMHNVTSGHPNVCDDQFIELRFDANVVNSDWNISGTVGILPATIINGYFTFTVILPDPPSSGYGDVWLQSPCGDFYTLRLVYDCTSGCVPINVNVLGNVNNSCENLTVNASGGTAPNTYQISGDGSLGTDINQNGSSNIINLSSLQNGESITLSITVTDVNGCTGTSQVLYTKCSNGCSGNICNNTTPECNDVLGSTDGYNQNAIINFIVPSGVTQVTLKFNPQPVPQSYIVKHNSTNIINVGNIYTSFETDPDSLNPCQNQGRNIIVPSQLDDTGLTAQGSWATNSISVNQGDLITIIINHPSCCGVSWWNLQILCGGSGSRPSTDNNLINIGNHLQDAENENLSNTFQLNDLIRFYPNPFSKGINMEFTAPQSDVMKMEVYNQVGIQVFTKTIDLMQGINLRYIDEFENMPTGVYTVKMRGTQSEHHTRVIKIE